MWSKKKATEWSNRHGWIIGANFIPSTAVNQFEMWQEDTFDPVTINTELGYAKEVGFNSMRVFCTICFGKMIEKVLFQELINIWRFLLNME